MGSGMGLEMEAEKLEINRWKVPIINPVSSLPYLGTQRSPPSQFPLHSRGLSQIIIIIFFF